MHVCHAWPSLTLSIQNASEIQVERELERCKKELKKDLEHARIISEQVRFSIFEGHYRSCSHSVWFDKQDRAHRERIDLGKKKLKDVVEASETLHK